MFVRSRERIAGLEKLAAGGWQQAAIWSIGQIVEKSNGRSAGEGATETGDPREGDVSSLVTSQQLNDDPT